MPVFELPETQRVRRSSIKRAIKEKWAVQLLEELLAEFARNTPSVFIVENLDMSQYFKKGDKSLKRVEICTNPIII